MRFRRMAAAASTLSLACALVLAPRAEGAVGRHDASTLSSGPAPGTRAVQGRVQRLEYRVDGGYPVTDVHLEPGGDVFTVLGGVQDGILWVAEEEASFSVGDHVEISLVLGRFGWRPSDADAPARPAWEQEVRPLSDAAVPRVRQVLPPSIPAVADADLVVEIIGENFGHRQGRGAVLFQGLFEHVPAEVLSWSGDRIRCLVPKPGLFNTPQVLTGALKVWTPHGGWSDKMEWEGTRLTIPFQYAGDRYTDESLPIPVRFNPTGFPWPEDVVQALLERSIGSWNELEESYARFVLEGTTGAAGRRGRDGVNVVSWTEPWPHASSWLAVTWSAFDPRTGERLESDVEINASVPWSITDQPVPEAYNLRSVLTHEFGHWLRLGHVQNARSVMNTFVLRSDAVWRLDAGDRMGASWVYPSYGSLSATPSRLVVGSGDAVVLSVRAVDRLGAPRSGLAAHEIYAILEWEAETDGLRVPRASRTLGPYYAERATDGEGRTEILVPAPEIAGRARLTVVAGGNLLATRPGVEFTLEGRAEAPSGPAATGLSILGPNPGFETTVRAEIRLANASGPYHARVYDARGRLVLERGLGRLQAGANEIHLELGAARGATTGVYFLEVAGPSGRQVAKFVRLR